MTDTCTVEFVGGPLDGLRNQVCRSFLRTGWIELPVQHPLELHIDGRPDPMDVRFDLLVYQWDGRTDDFGVHRFYLKK